MNLEGVVSIFSRCVRIVSDIMFFIVFVIKFLSLLKEKNKV